MRHGIRFFGQIVSVSALAAFLAAGLHASADIPPLEKAPNDESEYRRFVLENGLPVILLSDPKLNRSSASLSVAVGSLADPEGRPGLAHFLEHMLFLGTEKFPDEAEYANYLESNGGYSNAYTADAHTNYHFEIRHEAFEGALDRFAQFFIAPLFTPEFTEREINAVDSEFQKNLENDAWREQQLRLGHYRPGHPASHFSIGNAQTLAGVTREELLRFYDGNYSANRMTLAVTGKAGLDQLERWARQYFSPIRNKQLAPIEYPADFLPEEPALRLIRMEPVKELRQLTLEFAMPGTRSMWRGKSEELIGFVLGYEGAGSLLSQLKAEGLATALSAGLEEDAAQYGSFFVQIGLTPEGEAAVPRVMELFFAAVDDMRRAPFPARLFHERRAMARLDELYGDRGEGADRAVFLANQIRDFPLEVAERVPFLWLEEDPAGYQALLGRLRPDNMLALLAAKGVETDSTERWFGTPFSYREEAGPAYAALLQPPAVASIRLPEPNPFIPESPAVLAARPLRLIDEPALSLFYAQDTEFLRPMVAEIYRFRLPRSMASLDNAVLLRFYEACVGEALNEVIYTAAVAGLQASLSAELEGVRFVLGGYSDSAPRLLDTVTGALVEFPLDEARFEAIKDRIVRGLRSFDRSDAWRILTETRRTVVREFYYRPEQQLPVAEKVTLADVRAFARRLYAQGRIEALIHGNITGADAEAAARRVAGVLQTRPVAEGELLRLRLLESSPGEEVRTSENLAVNNSAWRREYVLGGDTPEVRAVTAALANFIAEPFYSEMRTRQQLGYIVFGGAAGEDDTHFAYFIIQSGSHPADELDARADALIRTLPEVLRGLPAEAWAMIVDGASDALKEKDKTIAERAGRFFELAYDRDRDWGRREETLRALGSLTQERAAGILARAVAPETRQVRTFLAFARDHEAAGESGAAIEDPQAWKKSRTYE